MLDKRDVRDMQLAVAPWGGAEDRRAWRILVLTIGTHLSLLASGVAAANAGAWGAVGLTVLACAGFTLRLFSVQHDCGHGAFFESRTANLAVGSILSIFTFTPFRVWAFNHSAHHEVQGNLDRRGVNEIFTMTTAEFKNLGIFEALLYRIYRSKLFLLIITPPILFFILYRFPKNGSQFVSDTLLSNFLILTFYFSIFMAVGLDIVFFVSGVVFIAGAIGIFIFYIQHNFEDTYWESNESRTHMEAAVFGSSVLDLGPASKIFDFFTLNIRYHHLHHLNSRIPSYRLRDCYAATSAIIPSRRLGFAEAVRSFSLKLWDEDTSRLVAF